jgi:glycosyltransferase involved in cell wall biosynthesis
VTDKIRILHLTSTPSGLGGVERLLLDMASHYDVDRFSVAHCNLFDETERKGPFPRGVQATGLRLFEIAGHRWWDVPGMVRALRALIGQERIDILHMHMVHATIVGGMASYLPTRAKVVVSKHYQYAMLNSAVLHALDQFFTNRADFAAAVSKSVLHDLARHGTSFRKSRVVHNGIDLESFDDRSVQDLSRGLERCGPLLASFGNLHARKGHEYAVMAMPEILRNHPAARLILVGEGPRRDYLLRLARTLGIADATVLWSFEANVPALMSQIDLCVHPSLEEPFGIALLEAMAARKPVVATNVDGIPEIVHDGITGYLVPPRDPGALANAICTLLRDPVSGERMGKAGRARVEREFTIQKTVRSYEALYAHIGGSDVPAGRPY